MREYLNKPCGCCNEKFTDKDDIVVCPECGTPIHRSCWSGHCPNESRHAEGYDWDADSAGKAPAPGKTEAPSRVDAVACEICGKVFEEGEETVYCEDCGSPMHRSCFEQLGHCPNEFRHDKGYSWSDEHKNRGASPEDANYVDILGIEELIARIRRREQENGEKRTCFGVEHDELIHFLGAGNFSTPRFYSLFFNMADTGRKVSFNILAGIFLPFYQFYRKMIGPSVILSLAYIILGIPQMVLTMTFALQGEDAFIPTELSGAVETFFFVFLLLRIVIMLFNDYIYMRWTVGKILSIREQYRGAPQAEYMQALEKAGAPRFSFVLVGVAVVSVLSYVLLGVISAMGYFA